MVLGMYTSRHQSRILLRQTYELKEHCGAMPMWRPCRLSSSSSSFRASLSPLLVLFPGACSGEGAGPYQSPCCAATSKCACARFSYRPWQAGGSTQKQPEVGFGNMNAQFDVEWLAPKS